MQLSLAELTPKGREVAKNEAISSQLKDPRLVAKKLQVVAEKTKKAWVSQEAVSLRVCGCKTASEAIDYIINNNLLSANLLEFPDVEDDDLIKLVKACSRLNHLFIKSSKISNKALEHLKGMPLTSIDFGWCKNLTDKGLEHLKRNAANNLSLEFFSLASYL